jgi:hypothetical protein
MRSTRRSMKPPISIAPQEMIARMADHPKQIIFVQSIYLAHVAEALVEWMKLPELEATRERLGEMVDDALARAEE